MRHRRLGRTELEVSELGFGAWEIGWTPVEEGDETGVLLNRALDAGIDFVDSSAAYRWSEELIAKYIGHRRHEFIFATKCGSGRVQQDDGEWVQTLDYSAAAIAPQIDRSLQRMKTDYIDIMQLHSPSYDDLVHGDGIEGLKRAQEQGKVRFISLSADDDAAEEAVRMGEFDTLQISYNILQQDPGKIIAAARAIDMGIIIKEPVAQAVYEQPRPEGDASRWELAQKRLAPEVIGDLPRIEASLRWLLNNADVHTAIVGTTNVDHLSQNIASVERGALPPDVYTATIRD
ncbi:MAG: aldo/keto reductase [Gemmatimonadetes bacterium]|jgi:aryl-alcohol dehydrogenase-like predicted oxidoreductase|nr:aldo/keto reductase [Gemmatimonadota bacterium]MBT6149587.1 aldo/keto reductase [Gemmatimonadota bacterium]MBT7862179.1 aldo/keto reductase [Gemmatimonadota bacterium]